MRIGLAMLGACFVVACGKPAAAPASVSSSHLTLTSKDGKFDASGRAFAAKGANGSLALMVVSGDGAPTSCDGIKALASGQTDKITMLTVSAGGFANAAATLDVVGYAYMIMDSGAGKMSVGGQAGEAPTGSKVTITKVTSDALDATLDAGTGPASGEIHATMCSGDTTTTTLTTNDAPAPPPPPATPADSHVTLVSPKGKLDINGHGFAWQADGKLNVAIVDDATTPPLDCTDVASMNGAIMSGVFFSLVGDGYKGKPGKLKVSDHSFTAVGDGAKLDLTGADKPFGSALTLTKVTKDSVDATIAPTKKGLKTAHASGSIHATLCP